MILGDFGNLGWDYCGGTGAKAIDVRSVGRKIVPNQLDD